jgi:D-3-phosphoglycerate dehydrogenase / 2-oxoglutarate reductase
MPSTRPYRILTFNEISRAGLDRFPPDRYAVGRDVDQPDAILLRSHDLRVTPVPASIRAIARVGAGTNNIPVDAMTKRGIPVFNTPGANANAVKELVFAALLMAARNIVPALAYVARLDPHEEGLAQRIEQEKRQFVGIELPGRVLGIVGLGAIGSILADAAIKFGMDVVGFDPEITVEGAWRLPNAVRKAHSIEDLLRQADFVTLHVPLLAATRHLIDERRLAAMKPGASLLNFARDAIVDEDAIMAALRAGRLRYYLCDFPSGRLLGERGVMALPHLGASTREAEDNCAVMAVDQLRGYLETGAIVNAVNFPTIEMANDAPYRVAITNANVPNMLAQISAAISSAGLNIDTMVNRSRGDMAYTLVDVDRPAPTTLLDALAAIEGVLTVRAIVDERAR